MSVLNLHSSSHLYICYIGIIRSFKARYKKLHVRWRMDLIEANMERRINVQEAFKFADESWNSIGGEIIRSFRINSEIVEAPQVADLRAQHYYQQSSLTFQ